MFFRVFSENTIGSAAGLDLEMYKFVAEVTPLEMTLVASTTPRLK